MGAGNCEPQPLAFHGELVARVARVTAEWMAAGFTHGVLNTDNMSLAGESFDYGPFAVLEQWDPRFAAAFFDHSGLHAYGQQPAITHHNRRLLQKPLAMLLPRAKPEARVQRFAPAYDSHSSALTLRRLGLIAALPGDPAPRALAGLVRRLVGLEPPAASGPDQCHPGTLEPPRDADSPCDRAALGGDRPGRRLGAPAHLAGRAAGGMSALRLR